MYWDHMEQFKQNFGNYWTWIIKFYDILVKFCILFGPGPQSSASIIMIFKVLRQGFIFKPDLNSNDIEHCKYSCDFVSILY